jgi:tetratricopeptide (TPR) repeat protein
LVKEIETRFVKTPNRIESPPMSARAQAAAAWIALFVRWKKRLLSWAEAIGNFWAKYWLLVSGTALILGSVVLKWVQFPFSHNLSGVRLSLVTDPGISPHISLFSVGVLGALILIAGIVLKRIPSVLALAAAILVMLWAITPAQIAFRQPSVLRRLTYELQVAPVQNVFTKDYLVQNYGSPELVPKRLGLESALGRFIAAWSFLRFGWYTFGIGAFLVFIYAIRRLPNGRLGAAFALLGLSTGALLIVLIPPAIGQHHYSDGVLAKAEGRNQEAIADSRKAMRWDAWHAEDVDLYATIGQLQKEAGISFDSPERHIKRAVDLRNADEYEQAIFEFSNAGEAEGAVGLTAKREAAATRVTLGLALYHAGGIGGAVTNWELALAEDPSQIYALPFLVRGYYDLGRYQSGIDAANRLADLIKDHSYAVANVYSTAGDCYAKLGNDAEARRYYNLSLTADPILNYWALTGLAGE